MPQTRHPRPSQVIPHILQNTFRAIGHRTAHRPLCHEYLAPDRTTFSGITSFYTVLWHITLKAICKITELLTCLKHATPGQSKLSFSKSPCPLNPHPHRTKLISLPVCLAILVFHRTNTYRCRFCPAIQAFHLTNLGQSANQIAGRRTAKSDLNIQTR